MEVPKPLSEAVSWCERLRFACERSTVVEACVLPPGVGITSSGG